MPSSLLGIGIGLLHYMLTLLKRYEQYTTILILYK